MNLDETRMNVYQIVSGEVTKLSLFCTAHHGADVVWKKKENLVVITIPVTQLQFVHKSFIWVDVNISHQKNILRVQNLLKLIEQETYEKFILSFLSRNTDIKSVRVGSCPNRFVSSRSLVHGNTFRLLSFSAKKNLAYRMLKKDLNIK